MATIPQTPNVTFESNIDMDSDVKESTISEFDSIVVTLDNDASDQTISPETAAMFEEIETLTESIGGIKKLLDSMSISDGAFDEEEIEYVVNFLNGQKTRHTMLVQSIEHVKPRLKRTYTKLLNMYEHRSAILDDCSSALQMECNSALNGFLREKQQTIVINLDVMKSILY